MALITPSPSTLYERILIYGAPKTGKTRFATSLPERFGRIRYFAADPGSERLDSVLLPYRPRIAVTQSTPEPGKPYNPRLDAFTVARNAWEEETLIWDTLTETGRTLLTYTADTGAFSESHVTFKTQKGAIDYQTQPDKGDYGAVQNAIDRLITFLFQQPRHLIVICHEGYDEAMEAGQRTLKGGPLTVGKATIGSLPGRFSTTIRLTKTTQSSPAGFGKDNVPKVIAWTETVGVWAAGIRSHHPINPMASFEVGPDPNNFWKAYDQHFLLPAGVPAIVQPS